MIIQKSPTECNRVEGVSVQNTGRKLRQWGKAGLKFIGPILVAMLDFRAKAFRTRIAKESESFMPFGRPQFVPEQREASSPVPQL
jgi:hypothetical protein